MTRNDTAQVAEMLGLSVLRASDADGVSELDVQVGNRVRLARGRRGLAAAQVAAAVGLTRDKLSKIEHGKRRVSPRELPALATALSVSMATLLGTADPVRPALVLAHRVAAGAGSGASSGARGRAVALLEAEDRLAQHVQLPERTLSPPGASITRLATTEYAHTPRTSAEARRQGRALAEEVRRVLELGTSEIGDMPWLVEMHFAADVALSPLGPGSDGLCAHQGTAALLVVNTDYPLGRTRFTLAHELGHHLLDDARDVIEEEAADMFAKKFSEQRVNAFAGHLLLPVKAVLATVAWLDAAPADLAGATVRGRAALGYLMVRYGVSLPCALQQVLEAGLLTVGQKLKLTEVLRAGELVGAAEYLIADRPGPEQTLRDRRPPARLATAVLDAARSGLVGMHTVAAVLDRTDDDELFDDVMYDDVTDEAPTPALG